MTSKYSLVTDRERHELLVAEAVQHDLRELLKRVDEDVIIRLFSLAIYGGLDGKRPLKAGIYAMITEKVGIPESLDLKSLDDDDAKAAIDQFKMMAGLTVLPRGHLDRIDRYFTDVLPEDTAKMNEKLKLLETCCEQALRELASNSQKR